MAKERESREATTPAPKGRETPPPKDLLLSDYSFLIQTIMELQRSEGRLTQAVESLTKAVEKQGDKLTTISERIYAASVVMAIAIPILAFAANWLAPVIVAAIKNSGK